MTNAPPPGSIPRSSHSGRARLRPKGARFEYPEPRELTAEEMDAAADVLIGLPMVWVEEAR